MSFLNDYFWDNDTLFNRLPGAYHNRQTIPNSIILLARTLRVSLKIHNNHLIFSNPCDESLFENFVLSEIFYN